VPNLNPPQLQQRGLPPELDKYLREIRDAVNPAVVKGDTYVVAAPYTARVPLVVPTDWVSVGAGGTAPAFQNTWANGAAHLQPVSFKKDTLGFGHLRGAPTGPSNTVIFTLPSWCCPAADEQFPGMCNNGYGYVTVGNSGNVTLTITGGVTGTVSPGSIAGVTFQCADSSPYIPSCFPFDIPWSGSAPPTFVLAQAQDVANAQAPANLALGLPDWIPINQKGAVTSSPSLLRIRNIPGLRPGSYAVQILAVA